MAVEFKKVRKGRDIVGDIEAWHWALIVDGEEVAWAGQMTPGKGAWDLAGRSGSTLAYGAFPQVRDFALQHWQAIQAGTMPTLRVRQEAASRA